LLKCTRKIFYHCEVLEKTTYPNKAAAELFLKDPEQFKKKCDIDVQNSLAKVYDADSNDANYIRFSEDFVKRDTSISAVSEVVKNSGIGLSWIKS
jgi:hypothetical protein